MFKFVEKQDIVISKKDYAANITKAFMEGYDLGLQAGRQEGLMTKVTPNELRKCLGLGPLKGEERWQI